ncbi:Protein of unknown function [Pyronema omphalodes CBS 100304]|uniref:Uncharacterized protein n=1 Tax=Pyronema omphalodes (strain CBS 100304) TaxID=1076935 RepID=U4L8R8_PYROM|nr:Protein of unknown function [Pyronema omphalodes CBS 100304]
MAVISDYENPAAMYPAMFTAVAARTALQAPTGTPPAIAFGLLSLPDHVQAPITPSQNSRARRPQAVPRARKPRAPRETATQATPMFPPRPHFVLVPLLCPLTL